MSAFDLPDRLAAKAQPALIDTDERQLAAVTGAVRQQVAELTARLEELRRAPGGRGRGAMDRDLEIHRLSGRLRLLRRYSIDLCLGRMITMTGEAVYLGRLGLTGDDGQPLLVDWRAPAAEPFFAATHAAPLGLAGRRRYRWAHGAITDYWDEAFTPAGEVNAALDDDSAFIASLGSSRSPQMRDVLATIATDQDAIVRAGSRGALVVEGGPGTGKTVVALHRAAYLLYADPRLGEGRGGVLFVGPHRPYLNYIADVLPSLGEEGVQTCTIADLVAEGAEAAEESDPAVAALKADARMATAIGPAVALYEEPPSAGLWVETAEADVWLSAADWAEAFAAPDPATPHNEARDEVLDAAVAIVIDKLDQDVRVDPRAVRRHPALNEALDGAWTLIEATDLVEDLWSVPAYLRRCAPWLSTDQIRSLQREEPRAWTTADLPLLDAARLRLGDPEASRRRRRREAADAAERAAMDRVVEDLLAADDDPEGSMQLLRRDSIRNALVDEGALPAADPDRLAGPFAHVVVDEAQELSDAEWQMLLRRCPSRSFTIVGDRAQARHGFTEPWPERLQRLGFDEIGTAALTINYRTPEEVMAAAAPVIRSVFPDANVPTSIRGNGLPVRQIKITELPKIIENWLVSHPEGTACVIGDPAYPATDRVRSLSPEHVKGLEFDLVVLVEPEAFGAGLRGTVDRYVAMTRATEQLVIARC